MPADVDYVEELNAIADRNQRQLSESLITLENRIIDLMAEAPLKDGSLFDLEWAVKARAEIRKLVEDEYLATVDDIVRKYGGVALDTQKMLETYGSFTKLDPEIIRQLQTLEFQGFQEVGTEYLDVVSKEVYQNTLTGTSFAASIASVKAVQGGRLASNAKQLVHDSLMQFDAAVNTSIGKQSGATKWKYVGRIIETTRPFCRKHEGQTFTEEEIANLWEGSWAGKASGDPFIVRGGYNCGHQFRPVFDEEDEVVDDQDQAVQLPDEKPIATDLNAPEVMTKSESVSILNSRTATANIKPDFDSFRDPNYNGKSQEGYQLKGGEFQSKFRHGWTSRSGISPSEWNQKVFKTNVTTGLTKETLSILNAALLKTDKIAKAYGVPKIRSIGKAGRDAAASMGDSVLSINHGIFNQWSKKAYASQKSLDKSVIDLQDKLDRSTSQKKVLRDKYDQLREKFDTASVSQKEILRKEILSIGAAYNKEVDKWSNLSSKLRKAEQQASPAIPSAYLKGKNLEDRPFTADGFFESTVDKSNAVIFHEFGHNIHQQYMTTVKNYGGRFTDKQPPLEVLLESMFKKKPFFPTKYSETNSHEWFAENFTLYQMGRKDLIDDELLDLITALEKSDGNLSRWKNFNLITGEYDGGI